MAVGISSDPAASGATGDFYNAPLLEPAETSFSLGTNADALPAHALGYVAFTGVSFYFFNQATNLTDWTISAATATPSGDIMAGAYLSTEDSVYYIVVGSSTGALNTLQLATVSYTGTVTNVGTAFSPVTALNGYTHTYKSLYKKDNGDFELHYNDTIFTISAAGTLISEVSSFQDVVYIENNNIICTGANTYTYGSYSEFKLANASTKKSTILATNQFYHNDSAYLTYIYRWDKNVYIKRTGGIIKGAGLYSTEKSFHKFMDFHAKRGGLI